MTGGNTDTKNFNLTFDLVRDPKNKNIIRSKASYLRGTQSDILSLDRAAFSIRDERTLGDNVFAFAQLDYLRDRFKDIIFLWAPTGGLGYKLLNTDAIQFAVTGGAGGFFEKDPGKPVSSSGSVTAGERFLEKFTNSATFTESLDTIWKTDDFGDSLTNFSVGLTTSVLRRVELKIEFLDNYKTKPSSATIKKNDRAFVTAFIWKF